MLFRLSVASCLVDHWFSSRFSPAFSDKEPFFFINAIQHTKEGRQVVSKDTTKDESDYYKIIYIYIYTHTAVSPTPMPYLRYYQSSGLLFGESPNPITLT